MDKLLEILSPDFVLRNALYASLLLGAVVPIVGVFVVIGRRTVLALALPQVSTFGVAVTIWLATRLGLAVHAEEHQKLFLVLALAGALTAMGITLLWEFLIQRRCETPADAETGAAYALAVAGIMGLAAGNLVPELGLLDVLRGEILAVPNQLLVFVACGFVLILATLALLRHALHFVLYDHVLAYAAGFPADGYALLTIGLISLTIALGGLCAGPLTVFAFLVLPPLTFFPMVRHLRALYIASSITGVLCAFCGFWISYSVESWTIPIPSAQILLLCLVWIVSRLAFLCRRRVLILDGETAA